VFAPDTACSGLDLLASAVLTLATTTGAVLGMPVLPGTAPILSVGAPNPNLSLPGPFNQAASLSTRVTRKILALEYVEMAEVTSVENLSDQVPGRPTAPGRPPVTDISQWMEKFSLMAALIATRFPHKAPELFAYQAMIIRAERNYEAGRWVAYDRQFSRAKSSGLMQAEPAAPAIPTSCFRRAEPRHVAPGTAKVGRP